jgi:hypothetical protein
MTNRKPKIFISYVNEDIDRAEKLYKELCRLGFDPWMDKYNIHPGEDWKYAVKAAIRDCDFFVACLSKNSVDKRGVFQEEIKEALDLWRQKKEDDIFIIPVRFEDCKVPISLESIQWVNLFEKFGLEKLKNSIQEGMNRLGITLPKTKPQKNWESIDNPKLIEDNFLHIEFELNRDEPYFRIAKESDHALFRSMIETLRGTANLDLIESEDPKRVVKFQHGNNPWMEIHKVSVPGCKVVWRYSKPEICDEPSFSKNSKIGDIIDRSSNGSLISFWDALAMIQTTPFMRRYVHSRPVHVSNNDMKILEWLHLNIKKEFDEFMPKHYSTPIPDLLRVSSICVKLCKELLFESGLVLRAFLPDNLEMLIMSVEAKI